MYTGWNPEGRPLTHNQWVVSLVHGEPEQCTASLRRSLLFVRTNTYSGSTIIRHSLVCGAAMGTFATSEKVSLFNIAELRLLNPFQHVRDAQGYAIPQPLPLPDGVPVGTIEFYVATCMRKAQRMACKRISDELARQLLIDAVNS